MSIIPATRWRPLFLIICVVAASGLAASWVYARVWWHAVDVQAYHFFNGWVASNYAAQIFWAMCSSHAFDMLAATALVIIYLLWMRRERALLAARLCLGLFMALYIVGMAQTSKRMDIERDSPSLVIAQHHNLEQLVPWAHPKVRDGNTFPSDHAMVLLMVVSFIVVFARGRAAWLALAIALFACLPRLVAGAHWLSDMLVGSMIFNFIGIGLAFGTPLTGWAVRKLMALLAKFPSLESLAAKILRVKS